MSTRDDTSEPLDPTIEPETGESSSDTIDSDHTADADPEPDSRNDDTLQSKLFIPLVIFAGLALLLVGGLIGYLAGGGTVSSGTKPAPAPTPSPTQEVQPETDIPTPKGSAGWGEPIIVGDLNAPVSVAIVEDFACPFCATFHNTTWQDTQEAVDAGKAKFEYFVVAFLGQGSFSSAEAASCAADQDAFTTYSHILYNNEQPSQDGFTQEQLIRFAETPESGVNDIETFTQCVQNNTYRAYVESINQVAQAAGIPGTPSVVVDQKLLDIGSLTPEVFRAILDGTPIEDLTGPAAN